jgi:iron complex outermembrane recepter protein
MKINRTVLRWLAAIAPIAFVHPASLVAQATTPPADQPVQSTQTNPTPVAQTQNDSAPSSDIVTLQALEVVTTGTEIRGIDPIGTKAMIFDQTAVATTGALNANDFLASVPQSGLFGGLPQPTADFGVPTVRPNIRGIGNSGANSTLILMDGHRIVGAGFLDTTPDATIFPPQMIDRVEILADGGSPIYGSDAVGGVINFVMKKNYDGTGLAAHYGLANGYHTYDVNLIRGFSWTGGTAVISYSYSNHNNLLGGTRSYNSENQVPNGGNDGREKTAVPANITVPNGTNYIYNGTGFVQGTALRDGSDYSDLYPSNFQTSVFAAMTQKFNDVTSFDFSAYWSQRYTIIHADQDNISGTINNTNPFFQSIGGETSQTVNLNLAPVLGESVETYGLYTSMGATGGFTFNLGGDWQLRVPVNFGYSRQMNDNRSENGANAAAALAGTTTTTALDPYVLSMTNPAVIAGIADNTDQAWGTQELASIQAIADGTLFKTTAGNAKLAIGTDEEYYNLAAHRISGEIDTNQGAAYASASRSSEAGFAELAIPLIGKSNSTLLAQSLKVSLSGRIDSYSDFGTTENPKVGLTWSPFSELTIRGNLGTSFVAPSLADTTGGFETRAGWVGVSPWRPASDGSADFTRATIILAGTNGNLQPMKGRTWSVGADWTPKVLPGITFNATFWNDHFTNSIGITPFYNPVIFTNPGFAKYYTINPTLAQLTQILGNQPLIGFPSNNLATLYADGDAPYVVLDAHRHNFGIVDTDGVDLEMDYYKKVSFGAIHANFNGTEYLAHNSIPFQGGLESNDLDLISKLEFSASAGFQYGRLDTTVTVDYTGGYPLQGSATQNYVKPFYPVNLFFSYDLQNTRGWTKNLKITLNIENVGNISPPNDNASGDGQPVNVLYNIGNSEGTLGFFAMLGVEKRF